MTYNDHQNCYTCNSPVLPVNSKGDTYEYTVVHWNKEYIFCSKSCKEHWETDTNEE